MVSRTGLLSETSTRTDSAARVSSLGLVLASSSDVELRPYLKTRLAYPHVTARALRAVADMAGARFYVPPAMLARILREADPVATVSADAIRFEGFSACCSAYIRLDLDDEALTDSEQRSSGTTNVDFGTKMKSALAKVRPDADLFLQVGSEGLSVTHERASATEEKVLLPLRWIRGFAEVQQHMAGMERSFSLSRLATLRFLRSLPRSKDDRQMWVGLAGQFARISASPDKGAVPLKGAHRLALLQPMSVLATGMDVYWHEALGSTAWVLNLPGQRLAIVLNAQPWRGFSGDGQLLSWLASGTERNDALLRAQLGWQSRLDESLLAIRTNLGPEEIRTGLARLAAAGLLGYDLARRSWFHRVLPFDLSRLEQLNPRLQAAFDLVARSAVSIGGDSASARVTSGDVIHAVSASDGDYRCTCPWYARNGATRGPCKHVLAFEIALQGIEDDR